VRRERALSLHPSDLASKNINRQTNDIVCFQQKESYYLSVNVELARTFLEVVGNGSFVAAAERLHITQTAVSARIRTLEDQLGRRLFVRNKAGARLTPAGERFQRDALTLMQVWERARQRVALPPGHENVIGIGGELSLWSPLLANWLIWMRLNQPSIALRAAVNTPGQLLDDIHHGELDLAILYDPPLQTDLAVELVTEEKLVMVTSLPDGDFEAASYIHIDWGPAFDASQRAAFPNLSSPAVAISFGPLAIAFILNAGGSGYFRLSVIRPYLESGRLYRVTQAPEFSYSIHAVYSLHGDADLINHARAGLRACAGLPPSN
jgi:DNA-binding transcriptional LysR family regulator